MYATPHDLLPQILKFEGTDNRSTTVFQFGFDICLGKITIFAACFSLAMVTDFIDFAGDKLPSLGINLVLGIVSLGIDGPPAGR